MTGAVTRGHTNHENARTREQGLGQAGTDVGDWMVRAGKLQAWFLEGFSEEGAGHEF